MSLATHDIDGTIHRKFQIEDSGMQGSAVGDRLAEMHFSTKSEELASLRQAYRDMVADFAFDEGDIVCWKPRMKNKKSPAYGQPAVVMKVYDQPLYDMDENLNSPYYGEKLNVRLGFYDKSGTFTCFLFDGGRFCRYCASEDI